MSEPVRLANSPERTPAVPAVLPELAVAQAQQVQPAMLPAETPVALPEEPGITATQIAPVEIALIPPETLALSVVAPEHAVAQTVRVQLAMPPLEAPAALPEEPGIATAQIEPVGTASLPEVAFGPPAVVPELTVVQISQVQPALPLPEAPVALAAEATLAPVWAIPVQPTAAQTAPVLGTVTPKAMPVQSGASSKGSLQAPAFSTQAGRQQLAQGQTGLAIESFRKALANAEPRAPALNGLAVAYSRLGRFDLAQRFFHEAIAADPQDVRYSENLARLMRSPVFAMRRDGDIARAAEAQQQADAAETAVALAAANSAPKRGRLNRVSKHEFHIASAPPMLPPVRSAAVSVKRRAKPINELAAPQPGAANAAPPLNPIESPILSQTGSASLPGTGSGAAENAGPAK